ncbi:hypothetical protein IAU60_004842 [Kwoniella sp. DSM 27419]
MVDEAPVLQQDRLIALPPPAIPTDLIPSALFLPLHAVTETHRGRKLRLSAQILTFHAPTSLLLITAYPPERPGHPSPTLLVDLSTPLLGQSPAATDVSSASDSVYSRTGQRMAIQPSSGLHRAVNREHVSLARGEWVCIVGWLEGDGSKMVKKVKTSASFLKPLPIILEAIHISNARPPPLDALYRGTLLPGASEESMTGLSDANESEQNSGYTPRAKIRRR